METTFLIRGVQYPATCTAIVDALARAYSAQVRPRSMCVHGGVEMYIARHRHFVIKRMPGTGPQHHPSCESFEPDASCSGRGALMGRAILPVGEDSFDLRVDFPLTRTAGHKRLALPGTEKKCVRTPAPRMSLRALLHFLFEQAGFNRWSPAMSGRRHQGVIHKFLLGAAARMRLNGHLLANRLYVPEPFGEAGKRDIVARRRERLLLLRRSDAGCHELRLVIGEFKDATEFSGATRIRIRHMADAPLIIDAKAWQRLQRKFNWMFDLAASEMCDQVRIVMCMLTYANQEHMLHVDMATCMLTSRNWIPLDAACEVDVAAKLTAEERRFLKPLHYDAESRDAFANFLLLDTGASPAPLYIQSGFMTRNAFESRELAIEEAGDAAWVWRTSEPMPPLPARMTKGNSQKLELDQRS